MRRARPCAVARCVAVPAPGRKHCAVHAQPSVRARPSDRPITCAVCGRSAGVVRALAVEAPISTDVGVHVCCSTFGAPSGAVLWLTGKAAA